MGDESEFSHHIVVAEDEDAVAELVQYSLEKEGYRSSRFKTGNALLDYLETSPVREHLRIDMFIIDWMMPGKSGIDLVGDIRSRFGAVPIIMLSARGDETDRVRGLDAGCDLYVTKPFSTTELMANVRAHLRRRPFAGLELRADKNKFTFEAGEGAWHFRNDQEVVQELIANVTRDLISLKKALSGENTDVFSKVAKAQIISTLNILREELGSPIINTDVVKERSRDFAKWGDKISESAISQGIGGLFRNLADSLFQLFQLML